MAKTLIKNFTQISKADTEIAGGKGSSLGEMTQAGIPVPAGFVILANTFDKFIEETNLNVEIDAILDKVDIKKVHTVENASEKIQANILSKEIPGDIRSEILGFYKKLGSKFVAVRSSATSEDSASAAWAGQLDSFLNTTEETILGNVKKCWASLFTPRAIFYRFEKELNKDKISVAVVVQKMVDSEESGVAFSVHPVTQDENQIIIEAGFGLGEAIVSGSITPDSYVIDKLGFKIIDITINEQTKALCKKSKGGNEWKNLGKRGKSQVLTEKEIIELSKLIVKIENHYGFPCDIEWAKEKGMFYITQSRPITTLDKSPNKIKFYDKFIARPFDLIVSQAYLKMLEIMNEQLGTSLYPILKYIPETKLFNVYYNIDELQEVLGKIGSKFKKDTGLRKKLLKNMDKVMDNILPYFEEKVKVKTNKEFNHLYKLLYEYMVEISGYGWIIPQIDGIPKEFGKKVTEKRLVLEKFSSKRDELFTKSITHMIKNIKFNPRFVLLEEITNKDKLKIHTINEREKGFLFYKGGILYDKKADEFLNENNIILREPEVENKNQISGNIAYKGTEKGTARIIYVKEDLMKIKKGDIIVSPMTRPDFVPSLNNVRAIITDEGGITCHAAIVAREMNKPCIIGTKIATKILKDGMIVEVDANQGVINILKKK